MSSKTKRNRQKMERAGKLNPEKLRNEWSRKPQTQVNRNRKAEQRRTICRKATDDGAVYVSGL